MASTTSETAEGWRAKLDKALAEKNFFTDLLKKIEDKTGVRRLYLVIGKFSMPHFKYEIPLNFGPCPVTAVDGLEQLHPVCVPKRHNIPSFIF